MDTLNTYKIFITGQNGLTPLHYAARGGHMNITRYLIESAKCNSSQTDIIGCTPLHMASASGQLDTVKFLTINRYCDPLSKNIVQYTPLHCATIGGHTNVIKFLKEAILVINGITFYKAYIALGT